MNITNVKISVCIPVYGVEKYIERCARSLFEQTMTDGIEFIFVNDCTKDKSIEILEQVLSEYPQRKDQVKIIHHEKNGGLVAARNTGLKHATGDYIIHCDSDDWVDLNMYETMYNKAIETDADMVYCDYYMSNETQNEHFRHLGTCEVTQLTDEMLYGNTMGSLGNKIFKRKIALQSDLYCPDHICMCEDLLRVVQMLTKCKKIAYISEPYYFYRWNFSSISRAILSADQFKNMCDTYDFFINNLSDSHKKTTEYLQCLKLVFMIQMPGEMKTEDFIYQTRQLGRDKIKAALPSLCRSRRVLLKIAFINYPLARFIYRVTRPVKLFIAKTTKK